MESIMKALVLFAVLTGCQTAQREWHPQQAYRVMDSTEACESLATTPCGQTLSYCGPEHSIHLECLPAGSVTPAVPADYAPVMQEDLK